MSIIKKISDFLLRRNQKKAVKPVRVPTLKNFTGNQPLEENCANKKDPRKWVSKLRRWQTRKLGSRATRAAFLTDYPYISVKGRAVK